MCIDLLNHIEANSVSHPFLNIHLMVVQRPLERFQINLAIQNVTQSGFYKYVAHFHLEQQILSIPVAKTTEEKGHRTRDFKKTSKPQIPRPHIQYKLF